MLKEFQNCNDLSIKLSVHDFGTGYSCLSYIKKFPVEFIKIDKSFISDIHNNNDSKALVKAIIAMAKALELEVVAEGVETIEQHEILKGLGCDFGQGFLYSKPLPVKDFMKMLEKNSPLI